MHQEYFHTATGIQTVGFMEKDFLGIVLTEVCSPLSTCARDDHLQV